MFISSTTSSGVSTTPRMLDNDALTMAADTWPRAIDVNAIDDCTVDGTRHRNSTPVVQVDGQHRRHQRPSGQPQHRENHERGGQHQQVQSPLTHAVPGLLRRQPGAVEEEQQCDRRFRGDGHEPRRRRRAPGAERRGPPSPRAPAERHRSESSSAASARRSEQQDSSRQDFSVARLRAHRAVARAVWPRPLSRRSANRALCHEPAASVPRAPATQTITTTRAVCGDAASATTPPAASITAAANCVGAMARSASGAWCQRFQRPGSARATRSRTRRKPPPHIRTARPRSTWASQYESAPRSARPAHRRSDRRRVRDR